MQVFEVTSQNFKNKSI